MKTVGPRYTLMLLVALSATITQATTIDTVLIGNPGNAPDQDYGAGPLGAVDYQYRIGTTEVTSAQYVAFLNAVATTDTHGLYNPAMASDPRGGILRSGTSGSFSYLPKNNMDDKPVNFVSFWDAARFANWLHNGQPTGVQDHSTTEDGAYSLGGVTNPPSTSVSRSASARWFLPSEDEWYKAAYHQPASQGGDTDDYWLFATATNADPIIAAANAVGDISNQGANVANHAYGADWNGLDGNIVGVGSAGPESASFYGTFDQAGNVFEWTEAMVAANYRVIRGGTWTTPTADLAASDRRITIVTKEYSKGGIRVARYAGKRYRYAAITNGGTNLAVVPEPTGLFSGAIALFGWAIILRRRPSAN